MKSNQTFLFYFLSYLLVIIVPVVCVGVFSYQLAIRTLEDELSQANSNLLDQQSASLNQVLKELHSLSVTIGLDGKVYVSANNADNPYLLNDVKDMVITWSGSNDLIHSIQVYFSKAEVMISSDGLSGLSLRSGNENGMEQLRNSGKREMWISTRATTDTEGNSLNIVTLLSKIPLAFPDALGYAAIHINEDKLARMLQNMKTNSHTNTYLADATGTLVSSNVQVQTDYVSLLAAVSNISEQGEEHYYVDKTRDTASLVAYNRTLDNGWMLVSETPMTYLIQKLSYIRNVTFTICLLLIALGAVISYFLSKSMYIPFKRLLSKNISLEASFRASLPAIRERFVSSLLNNKISSIEEIRSNIAFLQLDISMNGYLVMIVEIDDYPSLERAYSIADLNLYKFAIVNIAEEIVRTRYPCLSTEMGENQCVLLLNVQHASQDEIKKVVNELSEQIADTILTMLKFSVTISLGTTYANIEHTYLSYNEAADVIPYKLVLGTNKVIHYEDMSEHRSIDYYYPLQMERQIVNLLKSGNSVAAIEILDQLTSEVKSKSRLSYERIFRLYNRLLDAVLEALNELNGSTQQLFGDHISMYRELANKETVDAIHEWLIAVFTSIAQFARVQEKSNPQVDKALAYMQQYYRNDLSVEAIADAVGINSAYLSRIFKQQVGRTVVEYLTYLRLEDSKKLLFQSNMNIHDIARSVGYNNTNSYIRFFKKYEGITPGDYRKQK